MMMIACRRKLRKVGIHTSRPERRDRDIKVGKSRQKREGWHLCKCTVAYSLRNVDKYRLFVISWNDKSVTFLSTERLYDSVAGRTRTCTLRSTNYTRIIVYNDSIYIVYHHHHHYKMHAFLHGIDIYK